MSVLTHICININTPNLDAVFAANDLSAAGVYKALFAADLKIPEDMAVAGHDDIGIASLLRPELTTMRQPKYSLGERAVSVLLKMINNSGTECEDQILKTNLIDSNIQPTDPR